MSKQQTQEEIIKRTWERSNACFCYVINNAEISRRTLELEGQSCWLGCSDLATTVLMFAWCCVLLYEVYVQSLFGWNDLGKSFEVLYIMCYLPCFYPQGLVACCPPCGGQVSLCSPCRNTGFDGSLSGCQSPILWPGFSGYSTCRGYTV